MEGNYMNIGGLQSPELPTIVAHCTIFKLVFIDFVNIVGCSVFL